MTSPGYGASAGASVTLADSVTLAEARVPAALSGRSGFSGLVAGPAHQ